jgi:ATP-dependent exoDNAse (exonuclease V) alpha subunit
MQMGGKLIKLKTDCVVVQDGNDVMCKEGIGNFRGEKVPLEFTESYPFNNDYFCSLKVKDWRMKTSPTSSRLLCGRAGTGKTHQLKQDLLKLTDYVVTATTNKAATIINGQTIHKFLGIDQDSSFNIKSAIKVARKYKYIIIDEISMLPAKMYEILYEIKLRTKVKFIFVGDYDQLPPVEAKSYDYFNSLALKELVDFNLQQLTENKRSDNEMWGLFKRVDELNPQDFGNSLNTRVHLCYTNVKRKEINELMMKQDKLKKKRMLFIERNPNDPNSQDVHLMIGSPVIAIRNNKTIGIVNGETFAVKSLNPLLICSKVTGDVVELTSNMFLYNFYVNFCSTVHKCQGETYTEPFTIHEWNRMSIKMKYTAISRATRKNLINVMADKEQERASLPDTDYKKLKQKQKQDKRDKHHWKTSKTPPNQKMGQAQKKFGRVNFKDL